MDKYRIIQMKIEPPHLAKLDDVLTIANELSIAHDDCVVEFLFSGKNITVKNGDDLNTIKRIYDTS